MLMEIRGTRLHIDQRGPADAPALLFLHGGPGSGTYDFLSFQGDALARHLQLIAVTSAASSTPTRSKVRSLMTS